MCLSTPKAPTIAPVAPLAPLEPPKPMGMATSADSVSGKRAGGISQLRIQSASGAPLGSGAAAKAAMTIQGRKDSLDAAIAASGG